MRIAVFGNIHGHWCDIRDAVFALQSEVPLDLVLQLLNFSAGLGCAI